MISIDSSSLIFNVSYRHGTDVFGTGFNSYKIHLFKKKKKTFTIRICTKTCATYGFAFEAVIGTLTISESKEMIISTYGLLNAREGSRNSKYGFLSCRFIKGIEELFPLGS